MIKAVVIFLLSLFSLNIFSLDLTYNPPLDPFYCDSNPVECQPLPDILPKFDIQPRTTREQWVTFWTYQLLDVYTTSKALEYDCIKEVNPLFSEYPSNERLLVTKGALLLPTLLYDDGWQKVTPRELNTTNGLYTFVVLNNFYLLNDAKRNCNKIR